MAQRSFEAHKAEAIAAAESAGTDAPDWTQLSFTSDVGWDPAVEYRYQTLKSPLAVRQTVLNFSGPGVIRVEEGK